MLKLISSITSAITPLMWAVVEYLKLKNETILWDTYIIYSNELEKIQIQITNSDVHSDEFKRLHERRKRIEEIIANISTKLSTFGSGKGDTDD